MHFGKIVKEVAQSNGLSAADFAALLGRTEQGVLELYEQSEWTSTNIKAASVVLEYDFGKYLNDGFNYELPSTNPVNQREFLLVIRYPKGKGMLLQSWLSKIIVIAKAIGLEVH